MRNHHPVRVHAERRAHVSGVGPELLKCFAGNLGENIKQLQMKFRGSTEMTLSSGAGSVWQR